MVGRREAGGGGVDGMEGAPREDDSTTTRGYQDSGGAVLRWMGSAGEGGAGDDVIKTHNSQSEA